MVNSIAIDGPAGAGKSTIAKIIAAKLGYIYVDTGAMYRAIAVYVNKEGVDADKEEQVEGILNSIDMKVVYEDGSQQIIINDDNVTPLLRTEETGKLASKISKYAKVRAKLVELQRELAKSTSVVMDGRDIGTVVLPDATLKVYLTASSDARASRRYKELTEKGEECDYNKIKEDIENRDYQDMNRANSPLKKAETAVYVDSSDMTIEQVAEHIIGLLDS